MENLNERHIWDIDTDEQEFLDLLAMFGEGYVDLAAFGILSAFQEKKDDEMPVDNVA